MCDGVVALALTLLTVHISALVVSREEQNCGMVRFLQHRLSSDAIPHYKKRWRAGHFAQEAMKLIKALSCIRHKRCQMFTNSKFRNHQCALHYEARTETSKKLRVQRTSSRVTMGGLFIVHSKRQRNMTNRKKRFMVCTMKFRSRWVLEVATDEHSAYNTVLLPRSQKNVKPSTVTACHRGSNYQNSFGGPRKGKNIKKNFKKL